MNEPTAPIRRIVVVGGGTAGWLSAAYLQRALGTAVNITLIESAVVGPIGVGESTLPTLGAVMAFLGIEEDEWMPRVGATYKCGIKFVDWAQPPVDGRHTHFWHPFTTRPEPVVLPYDRPYYPQVGQGFGLLQYALRRRLDGSNETLAELVSPTVALCERKLSPRAPGAIDLPVPRAYHVDAGLLGGLLREKAVARGVKHVVDDVTSVARDERGFVMHVETKSMGPLAGDLFIDCSGFRGLLINQSLGEPFIDYGRYLLCDRAVAMPRDNDPDVHGIEPFTTARALDSGWSWNVPLFHRFGCGYVYSSNFISPEQAERELRASFNMTDAPTEGRHLKMRVGRTRRPWVDNVVAIGLSGGFVEPLEATAIFLIEYGLATLVSLFPTRECAPARARIYNEAMRDAYEQILDFIVLHYFLSHRDDTAFWRAARHEATVPDSLRERLEFLAEGTPPLDSARLTIFQAYSYACILDGFDRLPRSGHPVLEQIGYELGFETMKRQHEADTKILDQLPDHYRVLLGVNQKAATKR